MIAFMKLADEMREVFVRWKISGLSLMAFGKVEGVPYRKLLYWRRKLGDDARRMPVDKNPAASFAPIHIVPESAPAESGLDKFEVQLGNGISLDVASGFDEQEVRRLVGVLLSC